MQIEGNQSNDLNEINKLLESENSILKDEIQKLRAAENSTPLNLKEGHHDRENEIRFETIFETSRLGNKIFNQDMEIVQVNPAMVALLGYSSKDDLIGTHIIDFTPNGYQDHWELLKKELWQKLSPYFFFETCLERKDGSIIWCKIISTLFKDKGETLGYTIIEDITEQHIARFNKAEFINVISHELNTPITSIKASLQLMNRILKKETPVTENIIKLAQDTECIAKKLSDLVSTFLKVSNIDQDDLHLDKKTFVLSNILENCCSHLLSNSKHKLTFEGDDSVKVCADQKKIGQVILNLVNNAIKYSEGSTNIVVRVELIENKTKISVTDQGKGIAAESIPYLFDRYFRVENDGNINAGLGIGLFISAEIVRRHDGEIGVQSEVGKGSTFWFTIPDEVTD